MNLWRKTRTEAAGAWRSLRYDMGRRRVGPGADERPDDVTSTGMSTFGMPMDDLRTGYEEFGRPPRRLVAVSVFAALTVAGSVGSYFAIVNGLGSLLREKPAAPRTYPMAAAEPPADNGAGTGATAGLGRGAAPAKAPAVPGTAAAAASPAAVPPAAGVLPVQRRTAPGAAQPVPPPCDCRTPPVPTPTAPSTSPSGSASPSASPSEPGADDPSVSPDPSASTDNEHGKHRKRHPRGY
jgi:hypothetical protein